MSKSVALVGGLVCASAASAGVINVSNIGGGVLMNSGPLPAFGGAPTSWSDSSLAAAHAALNGSGVSTDGKITFVAADTDTGLSFMALVDRIGVEGPASSGSVFLDTFASSANQGYVNSGGSLAVFAFGGQKFATGSFGWNSNGGGDGQAWANLLVGNTFTYRFETLESQSLGLDDPSTFQFVTWTGSGWSVIPLNSGLVTFSSSGEYGFSAEVLVPAPATLMLAGFAALGLRRRR